MPNENIVFDFSKLRGRIKEIYGTQSAFAIAMLMNEATLSNKLNGNVEFSSKEIVRACLLLCIDMEKELKQYFFIQRVRKVETKKEERYENRMHSKRIERIDEKRKHSCKHAG